MNRQLVREAYFYLVGLALTLCPPLSTFLYVRLSSLSRGDLIPNCSVNTSLRLRASPPIPLSKNPSSRDPSSASFDEVFNAAGQQQQGERLYRPPILLPLPNPAKRGPPNTRPRYLRISADSFAIPAADWEGVDAGSNEGRAEGTTAVEDRVRSVVWRGGGGQTTKPVLPLSFSHGAPAIRSSKPTE